MLENIKNKTVDAMKNNEYEHKEDIQSVYGVKTDEVDNNNKKTGRTKTVFLKKLPLLNSVGRQFRSLC